MANHGGARQGAGRKTKAEELGLPSLIEEVIGESGKKEIIKNLYTKAKSGSFPHTQLLMAYIYGKPVENHKVDEVKEITIKYTDGSNDLISPAP